MPVAPEILSLSKQWSLKKNAFSASDLKKKLYKPYKSYEICNENLEDFASSQKQTFFLSERGAVTLLVGRLEGHPACKEILGVGLLVMTI